MNLKSEQCQPVAESEALRRAARVSQRSAGSSELLIRRLLKVWEYYYIELSFILQLRLSSRIGELQFKNTVRKQMLANKDGDNSNNSTVCNTRTRLTEVIGIY